MGHDFLVYKEKKKREMFKHPLENACASLGAKMVLNVGENASMSSSCMLKLKYLAPMLSLA